MGKYLSKRIDVPIYDRGMVITVTNDVMKAIEDLDIHGVEGCFEGVVLVKDGIIHVIVDSKANINTICHESFHVTKTVLCDAGLELSDESEEAFAYLNGWVAEKIYKVIKKCKKSTKYPKGGS